MSGLTVRALPRSHPPTGGFCRRASFTSKYPCNDVQFAWPNLIPLFFSLNLIFDSIKWLHFASLFPLAPADLSLHSSSVRACLHLKVDSGFRDI